METSGDRATATRRRRLWVASLLGNVSVVAINSS